MSTQVAAIRNVAFVGHPSSGKTTLIDALAHLAGATDRQGSVADKTSLCDTEPEEQEKGHTLQMKVVHASHGGHTWNLIDSPGYPDFVGETASAMFAADLVAGVVSCTSGVTFNLTKKMYAAGDMGRGRVIVVTHLDGENADFDALVQELRSRIGRICVPVAEPDQSGHGFSKVVSVLGNSDSPWRKRLMDRVMDACEDEELLMSYLEGEPLSDEALHANIPNAIAKGALIPILVCHPLKGLGTAEVLEFLGEFAPSPETAPQFRAAGEPVLPDPTGDLLAVVFAIRSDPHVGKICLARVLRGTIKASDALLAAGHEGEKGEKSGGLFQMVGGKKRDSVESVGAGDIVAFSKVEKVKLGDTVTSAGLEASPVEFPERAVPMVSLAVVPRSRADEQKIGEALSKLEAEDSTFSVEHVALTHELVIHGMSDLHLQVIEARLKRRYGVEIETHLPRIAYRETCTKPAEGHHRHKKQSGGRGQFGECYVRLKPTEAGAGVVFTDKIVGGSIPRNLIPAVEKGMREVAAKGILTKSQVVDVEMELYDGKFHAVDSDEASFRTAGGRAFKDAFMKAGPVLQEPIMSVEIHVPTRDAGTIFSDLTSQRRGHVMDQSTAEDGAVTVVKAHVPLSTMQTYFRDLKSQTAGEGTYSMVPDHYAAVPAAEQKKILAEQTQAADED